MKTILFSLASALIASAIAIVISYVFGARGEAFRIIAIATLCVSCTTSVVAASIAIRPRKKKEAIA